MNELRVFISSTFRDLQEEREHLVKKIFPEIRTLCRERGVTFTDIDLRWGLTEEQAVLGTVVRTCLEEVDKCRPFFIGIVGNRYGWIPEFHEIMMDPDLVAKYPWIEPMAIEGASLTEMEFIHGVFDAPGTEGSPQRIDGEYAFFYHRPGNIAEADDPVRLAALIERSRTSGRPFREFRTVEELGEQVRADLVAMVDRNWPEQQAPTPLEQQRCAHSAFAASRIRAYIPNPAHLKWFTAWLDESSSPLVVCGESGLGKSSLVAYLTDYYRKTHPTAFVIEHYVGASQASGSAMSVMREAIEEIRTRFDIDDEIPVKEEELKRSLPNWLFRCEHLAEQLGIGVLLVIDAVNQLGDSDRRMSWLPETIPAGVRLLISTTPGESDDRLQQRGWDQMEVLPLSDERVRQSIVVRYLGEYRKGITPEQVRRVTDDPKASSPLYLRVVAEELRLHGEHETLDAMIARYTGAADLLDVFDRVLERLEVDYGESPVRSMLSLIGASRYGLSETELMELTGMNRLEFSRLLFAIDYHLIRHDGLLGFFHDYLRRAVEKRYIPDAAEQHARHLQLAECFERSVSVMVDGSGIVPARTAGELAYQLHAAGAMDRLRECLAAIPVFLALYTDEMMYDVMGYWSRMPDGSDIEGCYRRGLEQWTTEDVNERSAAMGLVAELLDRLGRWTGALALQRERLASAITRGARKAEAVSRLSIANLLQTQGEPAEALQELTRAQDLFAEIGDRHGIAETLLSMGTILTRSGEYDRALASYQRAMSISEELGDRLHMAGTSGNIGIIFYRRGEFDRALDTFREQLNILQEAGDRRGIAGALHNIGLVHAMQGSLSEALQHYERALTMNTALGNRQWIANNLGAIGLVSNNRGEYDRALECYQQALSIAEELGDRHGVAVACGNMGSTHANRGEYEPALRSYYRAAEGHRAVGDRVKLAYWLQGIAKVLVELVRAGGQMPAYLPTYVPGTNVNPPDRDGDWRALSLRYARARVEECIAVCEELSMADTQFDCTVLLARIEDADGCGDVASQRLASALENAADNAQRAELHYQLWKLGDPDHASQALALYETLYVKTPEQEYRTRIEELTAASLS